MATSVREFGKASWEEVYNRIIGAVVFLDDYSAECLHWNGGLFNLLSGGAVAVKSLSPFENCKEDQKKAVFITQVTDTHLRTISEIIHNSDLTHCILVSCVSLDNIFLELNVGVEDVCDVAISGRAGIEGGKTLEKMLQEWINKKNCATEVVYIPIFTIAPTNVLFLTPTYSKVYPKFDRGLVTDMSTLNLSKINCKERAYLRRLASGLNSMLETMDMKEDIYYMGAFSSLLATVLENSPVYASRRKHCTKPVSFIIVDRTLDLCGVTSHSMDSVLDKVMSVLPRFPGHATDVAVNMSSLCDAEVITHPEDLQLSPGCLFHAEDESSVQTYDHMINKSEKEVMFDLYNKLSKMDVQKSPGLKTPYQTVTPQSLERIILATKGKYDIIGQHLGVLQQSLGMVQTLKAPHRAQLELLAHLERQVLQSLAVSKESTSVLHQMSYIIKTRKDRDLSLENLLTLLIYIYSLAGVEVVFNKQHEESLLQALSAAIFEDYKKFVLNTNDIATPKLCEVISKDIVTKLKDISQMRRVLPKYNSVLKPCASGVGYEYRGVLRQLVDDMVNTDRPELSDLRYKNEGIRDLFRSGLSLLTSKKKTFIKHPLDNPTVIIFVVGGISAEECKQLHRSVITSGVDNVVLFGSTKLVTPVEAMKDVLNINWIES